ncbi:MAG: type II toxin-antitoxin system YoeB family toxin [Erysipelotrichaceae bacterium]|nr:type II toxin-antitoxin system YoeB family toxin [Erysipelotrichaceae bacterium]
MASGRSYRSRSYRKLDIERNGYDGLGKPEPLLGNLTGYYCRRITS